MAFPGAMWAQTVETAGEALARASAGLVNLDAFDADFEAEITDVRTGALNRVKILGRVKFLRPNFARLQYRTILDKNGKSEEATIEVASNGRTLWIVSPADNRFLRFEMDPNGQRIAENLNNPIAAAALMFFGANLPHLPFEPRWAAPEVWEGTIYRVVTFSNDGTIGENGERVFQKLYLGADNLLHRMVTDHVSGKYVVACNFRNIHLDGEYQPFDFSYAPPTFFIEARAQPARLLLYGQTAPDFTVSDSKGNPVRLSEYRGKTVVLDFWSTGSPQCLDARERLDQLAKRLPDDVVFLSVNVWDQREAFEAWVAKAPPLRNRTFVFDETPVGKDVAGWLYQVSGLPAHYVIGPDGKVIRGFLGSDDLKNGEIEAVLRFLGVKIR